MPPPTLGSRGRHQSLVRASIRNSRAPIMTRHQCPRINTLVWPGAARESRRRGQEAPPARRLSPLLWQPPRPRVPFVPPRCATPSRQPLLLTPSQRRIFPRPLALQFYRSDVHDPFPPTLRPGIRSQWKNACLLAFPHGLSFSHPHSFSFLQFYHRLNEKSDVRDPFPPTHRQETCI